MFVLIVIGGAVSLIGGGEGVPSLFPQWFFRVVSLSGAALVFQVWGWVVTSLWMSDVLGPALFFFGSTIVLEGIVLRRTSLPPVISLGHGRQGVSLVARDFHAVWVAQASPDMCSGS